jgi:outer membrane protein assembly factor BamB
MNAFKSRAVIVNRPILAKIKAFLSLLLIAVTAFAGLAFIGLQFVQGAADAQAATVTQLWTFAADQSIVSAPVLANGSIYFTSRNSAAPPATLYCVNASSGTLMWKKRLLFNVFTVADGCVYVGYSIDGPPNQGHPTLLGVFSCLNASNGNQLWTYSYGTGFGTPVVNEGIVYVGGLNFTWWTGVKSGFIFAFNASTGTKMWNYTAPEGTAEFGSLTVANGQVYAVSDAIYAFNSSSGEKIWNYTIADLGSYTIKGDSMYVSCNHFNDTSGEVYAGSVLALRTQDGSVIWNSTISGSVESFKVAEDTVYLVSRSRFVYALDVSEGKVIWNYDAGRSLGSTFFVNGYLYVSHSAGVSCLNGFNGTLIWSFAAIDFREGSSPTVPTYADGVIYVGWNGPMFFSPATHAHKFYALIASSGKQLWNSTLGYTIHSYPEVANGTVYIAASFVTSESPDFERSGAVIALNSTVASLPLPMLQPPPPTQNSGADWVLYGIITLIVAVILVGAFAAFSVMKKKKSPKS